MAVSQQSFTSMHGPVASAPNLTCLQGMGSGGRQGGVRCASSSSGGAPSADNMYLQLQQFQHQQGVAVAGPAGLPPTGAGLCPGPAPTDEQLMLELTLALAAQPGGHAVADSAPGKLQLLGQLQAVVAAHQQQLQQQLHSRQAATAAVACANFGPVGLAARLSAPGCLAAQDDAMWGQRDQQCRTTARASARGYLEPVYSAGFPGGLLPLQQQPMQEVLSPCAFNNTPTALATLPPSLLAEVVGVDAAASIIGQAGGSMVCRVSSGSGSNGGCFSSHTATPTCVDALGMGVTNTCRSQPRFSAPGLIAPGVAEVPDDALQQQLHQAIEHLAGLQVANSAAAGSSGALLSGPLSGSSKNCWDWASAGDLLRSDSTASRVSSGISRSSSGIPSENSVSSNMVGWGDAGGAHPGSMLPPSAAHMPGCASGGVLFGQGSGLGPGVGVVLQHAGSNASCASGLSGFGAPAARSSCSGAAPGSACAPPLAASGSMESRVSATGSAGQATKQRPQGAASVDSLLRNCAPKWAKAGWNPKASVAAAPATKGTGAFVRLSSTGGGNDAGTRQKPPACARNGTGAFIPPVVRAAVAAAAGGLAPGSKTAGGTAC